MSYIQELEVVVGRYDISRRSWSPYDTNIKLETYVISEESTGTLEFRSAIENNTRTLNFTTLGPHENPVARKTLFPRKNSLHHRKSANAATHYSPFIVRPTPPPSSHIGRLSNQGQMSSSEEKRRTIQRFTNILRGVKSIFRHSKNPTSTLSASGVGVMLVAEIVQPKGSSQSEVKNVKDDSEAVPASPPSTSNVPEPTDTKEVGIAIQTEIDVVDIRGVHEALTKAAQESTPS
jgi:hypothetical protein